MASKKILLTFDDDYNFRSQIICFSEDEEIRLKALELLIKEVLNKQIEFLKAA
jgi:hypothetical protein